VGGGSPDAENSPALKDIVRVTSRPVEVASRKDSVADTVHEAHWIRVHYRT